VSGANGTPVPLRADCSSCAALCCVVPAFVRSAQFAITKPAGVPCPHLDSYRCAIHADLRGRGFAGCVAYDCFGAGQRVTGVVLAGRDWRRDRRALDEVAEALPWARSWHEVAWYLDEAARLPATSVLHEALVGARDTALELAVLGPREPRAIDADVQRSDMDQLLRRASDLARAAHPERRELRGASLVAARLIGVDLTGANLRGAVLLGADLRRATLAEADLTGADLRGADLREADLRGALFVTQAQLETATGDGRTRLPVGLRRPDHWASGDDGGPGRG
jgi:uncharacterized protein YjbI with pentapeptide repeats